MQIGERANEQAGGHHEQQREGHLGDRQCLAQIEAEPGPPGAVDRLPARACLSAGTRSTRVASMAGASPKNGPVANDSPTSPPERARSTWRAGRSPRFVGEQPGERANAHLRDGHACQRAPQRQRDPFREQLPDHPRATGPQAQPQRHFAPAGRWRAPAAGWRYWRTAYARISPVIAIRHVQRTANTRGAESPGRRPLQASSNEGSPALSDALVTAALPRNARTAGPWQPGPAGVRRPAGSAPTSESNSRMSGPTCRANSGAGRYSNVHGMQGEVNIRATERIHAEKFRYRDSGDRGRSRRR